MRRGGSSDQRTTVPWPKLAWALLAVMLAATACQAETQLVTPTGEPVVEQAAQPVDPEPDDPEPADLGPQTPGADEGPAPDDAEPTELDPAPDAPATDTPVLMEGFLGFSPDGRFAYDSSVNPWNSPFPCEATLEEPVIGIDLARSTDVADFVTFASGIDLPGVASELHFHAGGTGALVMHCGEYPDARETLVPVRIAPEGQLVVIGDPYPFPFDGVQYQWIRGMVDPGVVEVEVTLGEENDHENWIRQIQRIELATGDVDIVTELAWDDSTRIPMPGFTTPDGRFTYSEIDDPAGSIGCEGFGVSASIAVDDGSGPRPVFAADHGAWSSVTDMHFGPDSLVAWISNCEGYASLTIGRILDDGTIADAHWVQTQQVENPEDYIEFAHLRLMPDGNVVAMGLHWGSDGDTEPRFRVISLEDDPGFVTTGTRRPQVDLDNPVVDTIAGTGSWFVGELATSSQACDATSLFASTTAGLVHGVSSWSDPLGEIVDVHATPPVTYETDYGFEKDTRTRRTIVLVTECADEYIGRKVWFGNEPEIPGYGISFEPADLPAVANVLSVREEPYDAESPWSFDLVAEVVFRDGTQAEVVLEPVPYGE